MTSFSQQSSPTSIPTVSNVGQEPSPELIASDDQAVGVAAGSGYAVADALRNGEALCTGCVECAIEDQLLDEVGGAHAALTGSASHLRRLELLRKKTKRKHVGHYFSARQIAHMQTPEERYSAISIRLADYSRVRDQRPITCDAFWKLRDELDELSDGILMTLPSRSAHDDAFRRAKR